MRHPRTYKSLYRKMTVSESDTKCGTVKWVNWQLQRPQILPNHDETGYSNQDVVEYVKDVDRNLIKGIMEIPAKWLKPFDYTKP